MRKLLAFLIVATMMLCVASALAEEAAASVVEACLVTEVLDWGETLTAIRIEYSEEIEARAISSTENRTFITSSNRNILYVYTNNSGKLDDAQPFGKYVFIELDVLSNDSTKYLEQVAFNEAASSRAKLNNVNVYQTRDVETREGHVVPAARIAASKEIRTDIDAFVNELVTTVDGIDFYYNLYIPEGYEEKSDGLENLPMVVHYPSGDYACVDYNGIYNGALYRHNDCTVWASEEAQEEHPAFVLTIGASGRFPNSMYATYEELWATDVYYNVINQLIETYNVDTSRVYAISLAGGTTMMWNTIMEHPELFAASISTAFDFYMSYSDPDVAFANMKAVLDAAPAWFFAGMLDSTGTDPFGLGRLKGERLRDIAYLANEDGYHIDVAFGEEGELMWNGMLRAEKAAALAQAQLDRAAANGDTSLVTLFLPNTLINSQHWSWTAAYTNSGVRDWLFAQVKDAQ